MGSVLGLFFLDHSYSDLEGDVNYISVKGNIVSSPSWGSKQPFGYAELR